MKQFFSTKTIFSSGFIGLFYLCIWIISCVSLLENEEHVKSSRSNESVLFQHLSRNKINLTSQQEKVIHGSNLVAPRKYFNSVGFDKRNTTNKTHINLYGKSVYSKDNSVLPISDRNIIINPDEKRQNDPKKVSFLLSQITIKTSLTVENATTQENSRELTVTEAIPASVDSDSESDAEEKISTPGTSSSPEETIRENESKATTENTTKEVFPEDSITPGASVDLPRNVSSDEGTIPLRHKCNSTDQCKGRFTECRTGFCKCELGFLPLEDNAEICGDATSHHTQVPRADPTMIGVVIGLVLMSVTMCVVFRLFARARFRENRTIFNTANPRLMNASLAKVKGSKAQSRVNSASGGGKSRRGSRGSVGSASGQVSDLEAQESGNGTPGNNPAERRRSRFQKQLSSETSNSGGRGSGPPSRVTSRNAVRQDSISGSQQY